MYEKEIILYQYRYIKRPIFLTKCKLVAGFLCRQNYTESKNKLMLVVMMLVLMLFLVMLVVMLIIVMLFVVMLFVVA